jgi:hypothetical protein
MSVDSLKRGIDLSGGRGKSHRSTRHHHKSQSLDRPVENTRHNEASGPAVRLHEPGLEKDSIGRTILPRETLRFCGAAWRTPRTGSTTARRCAKRAKPFGTLGMKRRFDSQDLESSYIFWTDVVYQAGTLPSGQFIVAWSEMIDRD